MNKVVAKNGGELTPIGQPQMIVQMPASSQVMGIIGQVLANPESVVSHAVSLIDDQHNSVTVREKIIIYLED